jgi:hypothetical protein
VRARRRRPQSASRIASKSARARITSSSPAGVATRECFILWLAIADRAARADPDDAGLRRALVENHAKLPDPQPPARHARQSLDIARSGFRIARDLRHDALGVGPISAEVGEGVL